MKKLVILIPSYKRPEVLKVTLSGLLNNTYSSEDLEVSVGLGLNKASPEEQSIASMYKDLFNASGTVFNYVSYNNNIGKANILNILFKLYADNTDYVITLDNDMVISKSWLKYINYCDVIDYDIMGFSASRFWAHDPVREKCDLFIKHDGNRRHLFYTPYSVAGGMMLFHSQFLKDHQWTNFGGVYGRDDADMCLKTDKKFVLFSDEDWLVHDPLNSSTPILKEYEDKKKALYKNGTTVFSEGWDE